jgi:hypothetical protein
MSSSHTCEASPTPPIAAAVEEVASDLIRITNRLLRQHLGQGVRTISTTHGSRSYVAEWIQAGMTTGFLVPEIERIVQQFRPSEGNRQISSMRYFDQAVRSAWRDLSSNGSEASAIHEELPRSTTKRSGALTRIDGTANVDPDLERQAQVNWMREHPDETRQIRDEIEEEMKGDPQWGNVGEVAGKIMLEARLRQKVSRRMPRGALQISREP